MRRTFVIALTVVGIALPATAQRQQTAPGLQPIKIIGDAARGRVLVTHWCADCHGPGGNSALTDQIPSILWIAERTQKNPDYIRVFLNHPHAPMPPLDLDRSEIADVVIYLRGLGTP
ncbi:MAG: hypothetical protein JWM91_2330 [Rhodospirillales bacterium]|nr:hypothetical protein [Rhodospirillales bacterium]